MTNEPIRTIQSNPPSSDLLNDTTHQLVQALCAKHGDDYYPLLGLAETTTSAELERQLLEHVLEQSTCHGHLWTIVESPAFTVTYREQAVSTLTKWVARSHDANRLYVRLLVALTPNMNTTLADELAGRLLRNPQRWPDTVDLATIAERSPAFRQEALNCLQQHNLNDHGLPVKVLRVLIVHAPADRQRAVEACCRRRDRLTTSEKVSILAAVAATGDETLIEQAVPIALTIRWKDQQDFRTELTTMPVFDAALRRGLIAQAQNLAELNHLARGIVSRGFETELAARAATLIDTVTDRRELLRLADHLPALADQAFTTLVRQWPDVVHLDEFRRCERFERWLFEPTHLIHYLQIVRDCSHCGFAPLTRMIDQASSDQRTLIEQTLLARRDPNALSLLYDSLEAGDWSVEDWQRAQSVISLLLMLNSRSFTLEQYHCLTQIAHWPRNNDEPQWPSQAQTVLLSQVPVMVQNADDYAAWFRRAGTDQETRQAILQHVLASPDLDLLADDWARLRTAFDNPNP